MDHLQVGVHVCVRVCVCVCASVRVCVHMCVVLLNCTNKLCDQNSLGHTM